MDKSYLDNLRLYSSIVRYTQYYQRQTGYSPTYCCIEKTNNEKPPRNCPNCGAPVNGKTCEYCGTVFSVKNAEYKSDFDKYLESLKTELESALIKQAQEIQNQEILRNYEQIPVEDRSRWVSRLWKGLKK